jgi:hypothetical protein
LFSTIANKAMHLLLTSVVDDSEWHQNVLGIVTDPDRLDTDWDALDAYPNK